MNNFCNTLLYQYFLSVQIANIDPKKYFSCKLTIEWCFFYYWFFIRHTVTIRSKRIVPQSI